MRVSTDDKAPILGAACFNLGVLGGRVTQSFSQRVEALGITHKQVGLLAVVDAGLAHSQRDIAARLGVAPSLVVSLVDQLVDLEPSAAPAARRIAASSASRPRRPDGTCCAAPPSSPTRWTPNCGPPCPRPGARRSTPS